jgi:type VI secretion system FHA domain protein
MILTLDVTGAHAGKLGPAHRKVFGVNGGTIGRLPDNDWVLPDPYVSSHHARIRCQGDTFYIEDTSTNGVFINSHDNRLTRGRPHAIQSGDCIFIEPYEIRASISSPYQQAEDPFGLSRPAAASAVLPRAVQAPFPESSLDPIPGGDVDPLSLLDLDPVAAPAPDVPRAADLARSSVLADHYLPPTPAPAPPEPFMAPAGAIPDDYDPLLSDSQLLRRQPARPAVPVPAPPVSVRPPAASPGDPRRHTPPSRRVPLPGAGDDAVLRAVLDGAGLKGVEVTPELARSFGRILRVVVGGVMDVLQARQRIKEEFRMRATTFKPKENNPLKFSANVDDALHNLLVKRNDAYFEPVRAFEDAFDDVRNHQMAMLAGVRAAFEAMLAEFDPDRLQQEFDRQPRKGALISVPAKLRYWDMYRERVHEIVKDADTSFRELFGDEFARAYEAQLEQLKARDRGSR